MYEIWFCKQCKQFASGTYSQYVCSECGQHRFDDSTEDGPEVLIFRRERICILRDAMEIAIAKFREAAL